MAKIRFLCSYEDKYIIRSFFGYDQAFICLPETLFVDSDCMEDSVMASFQRSGFSVNNINFHT